jgi:V/A-type H+-transporting ATPase subunit I
MPVVPMQKVRLVVYRSQVDQALSIIQKTGAVEFTPTTLSELEKIKTKSPYAELHAKIQSAVQFLEPYAPKQSLWTKLREGSRAELSEQELQKRMNSLDVVVPLVDDFERLQVEFAEINERVRKLREQYELLQKWRALPIRLQDFITPTTQTVLIERKTFGSTTTLETDVHATLEQAQIANSITVVDAFKVALTIPSEPHLRAQVDSLLAPLEAEIINPPQGKETADVELIAVTDELAKAEGELALLHDQAEHFARTHIKQLRESGEILSWEKDRYDVLYDAAASDFTVVFDGWLKAPERSAIEHCFAAQEIGAVITDVPLNEGETPPVEIENNDLVKPFEAVTRLYGMPGHTDLDPTPFLAGFFFLFFGLSLTDVGYGVFLMIVSAIVITLFKVTKPTKVFAQLLFFAGFATVLVGAAFGGYLGITPDNLPRFLVALQQFDPIGNPLPVFYLALSLGVVQVMVGMLLKIYSEYKNGRFLNGLIVQGPWFFTFCMAILALLTSLGYLAVLPFETFVNLGYVGLVSVALSGAYQGQGIFGRVLSATARLYDSIGYFSDILSYSRLLALGLATTALAFAVNLIAGMVVDTPYVGYILAGVILLIGHLFNLAVNTLGAFIHSARLQFVEFFGKFIMGTGREFAPLTRSEKHLLVKDE